MRNIKIFTYLKIILFLLLVFVAVYYPTNEFDVITSNLLQIKILGQTAKIISTIFNDKILLLIMVLLSAFLFWIKEAKKAIFIFFSAGFGGLILFIIKYTVQRVRPLPEVFSGYSFPSGHSTIIVVFFLSLLFIINKKEILSMLATFAIIAVPISRVVLGAHFLSDVIAGLLLGSIVVDFMKVYYKKIYNIIKSITGENKWIS
ncbi:phosphatase PAP2 family protein [Gemella morbillorum]|jgi:putative membrane-associated phospholipid phosphatase|uniref:phosphatase PAP2 family protein n=1 Tax=Gemella morbillorum TaxID=29391 RepID=UPI00254D7F38|nr:phosphatase PAP2 family protein [Gemella morbillorum]MDK8239747.1 phosphatase PAP2 family protein [Gemella morbillorum]MDK8255299.1 phosphatase PAP2 family protein [Gemella morbillorum]